MKNRILNLLAVFILPFMGFSQVSTLPAEDINPEDSLVILVDLSALDVSKDYVQNLIDDHNNGMDIFMWTWNPYEFPSGHPKENGTGGAPWKNSNEILKMTLVSGTTYSYKNMLRISLINNYRMYKWKVSPRSKPLVLIPPTRVIPQPIN